MASFPSFSSRSLSVCLSGLVAITALAGALPAAHAQQTDAAPVSLQNPEASFARESPQNPLSPEMSASQRPRHGVHYKVNVIGPNGARPQVRNAVTPTCSSPHLSYFGGPVISHIQSVAVFWNSDVNSQITSNMAQFFADMANSSYMSALSEYGTYGNAVGSTKTNQVITNGSSTVQGITLVPSRCPASSGNCHVSDSQIQTELQAQIAASKLPAPTYDSNGNAQTIYMVFFPPKVSTDDGFGDTSCVQYCAYHNTGGTIGAPLLYGVLMDEFTSACSSGCGANSNALENQTDVASHEFAEAITDAEIGLDTGNNYAYPAAWGDNNNYCGEIGDICDANAPGDTITVSSRTWTVQQLWSNVQGKCASTGTITSPFSVNIVGSAPTTTPVSFIVTAKNPTGSTNTSYSGTVHLTSSDADASLPSDYTFVAGDSGVHSFNVTFQTAGSQNVTVTDTSNTDLNGSGVVSVIQAHVSVPNVLGDTQSAASSAITGAGLNVGTVGFAPSALYPSGEVASQNPGGGAQVNPGSSVNLTISTGALISPAPGSVLGGLTTFTWAPGDSGYQLVVGTTGPASADVYNSGLTGATSANVNIPGNGVTLYVRISGLVSSVWQSTDYTFTEVQGPALTSPTPGSTLTSTSQTFTWTPGATTTFQFRLGTTLGSNNIYGSGQTTRTSELVSNLPTTGKIYAVLYYQLNGVWKSVNYTYYTPTALTSPTPGSTLSGSTVTFSWNPGVATAFKLQLGIVAGGNGIYGSGQTTKTSVTVNNLPTNGETIHARLNYLVGSTWYYHDYTYKAQ